MIIGHAIDAHSLALQQTGHGSKYFGEGTICRIIAYIDR